MDSSSIVASLAVGLTFLAVYYHIRLFSFWSSRGIKGPRPWPIFGTQIYYIFKNKIDQDLEWSKRYGKVYGIYEGYYPALRVMDNKLLKHIYIKEFKSFTDRSTKFVNGDNPSRWVFFSRGAHWNNQRVLLTPMFTSSKMRMMFQTLTGCVDRFVEEVGNRLTFDKQPKERKETDKVVESGKLDFMYLTLDIISKAFFGLDLNTYKNKSSQFAERAFAFASFDVIYSSIYFIMPAFIRDYFKLDLVRPQKYEYFDKLSRTTIKQRKTMKVSGLKQHNDFIQKMIDAEIPDTDGPIYNEDDNLEAAYNDNMDLKQLEQIHKEQQSKKLDFRQFSELEIRANMCFLFIAGFETTSNSLGFNLFELAHKQDLQEEIYQELCTIKDNLGHDQIAGLKKLNAFISEVLRLYNPVTENNRVVTDREGVVLPTNPPIHLPYDTTISTNSFLVQRDTDYWSDPLELDISRFYPENRDKIQSCTYMPFGLGPRNCAGMRFALMTIRTIIAKLVLKYKILPGPKNVYPPKFNQHGFFAQITNNDLLLKLRQSE